MTITSIEIQILGHENSSSGRQHLFRLEAVGVWHVEPLQFATRPVLKQQRFPLEWTLPKVDLNARIESVVDRCVVVTVVVMKLELAGLCVERLIPNPVA